MGIKQEWLQEQQNVGVARRRECIFLTFKSYKFVPEIITHGIGVEKIRPDLAAVFFRQTKALIKRAHRLREPARDRHVDRNLFCPRGVEAYAKHFLKYVDDRAVVGHRDFPADFLPRASAEPVSRHDTQTLFDFNAETGMAVRPGP